MGAALRLWSGRRPSVLGTCWECCAADPRPELCSRAFGLLPEPSGEGQRRACRCSLMVLCSLQGGREVSDFISYLKREATNTPVLQEEDKTKKSKKKVKEDL